MPQVRALLFGLPNGPPARAKMPPTQPGLLAVALLTHVL